MAEGWREKKAQGLGSRVRRGPGHWRREAARAAGCGVVIRVEEGLDGPVASPPSLPLPSLHLFLSPPRVPLPFPPLPPSPTLPSAPLSPGLWPIRGGAECPSGFRGCLPGVGQLRRRGEDGGGGGGLRCPLVPERRVGSTTDSARPRPEVPRRCGPCAPTIWAPNPGAGGSLCPPSRLLLPGGLPGPSTQIPAPQPASCHCAESPGSGMRLWRPW